MSEIGWFLFDIFLFHIGEREALKLCWAKLLGRKNMKIQSWFLGK